jgi:hypothetical protein
MAAQLFYLPYQIAVKPTNVGAPGATITFYQSGTTTLLPIYSTADLTTQLANPLVADGAGRWPNIYLDSAQVYRLQIKDKDGAILTPDIDPYIPGTTSKGDPGSPGEGYATRTAMASRAAPALLDDVYLTEKGREGKFVVDLASNWTAAIAADATRQGVLVASTADATKVYVRADIWRHFWDIRWFGAIADNATDCLAAVNAFLATAAAVGKLRTGDATFNGLIGCDFPGYYFCSGLINLKTPVHLRGLSGGMGGTYGGSRIRFPAGVAGIVVNQQDTTGYTVAAVTATTSAAGSKIEGLALIAGSELRPAAGTTHGILVRARCTIQDCFVAGFDGAGIAIYADQGLQPMWGNSSGTHIRGGRVENNGTHGLHIKGSDANACDIVGLDTFGNGYWGKLDESFLANTFVGGQDAGNGVATYTDFPAGGQTYQVVYGQEGPASTTQPGTNNAVWFPLPGITGGGYPTWVSGGTYHSGGSFYLAASSTIVHPYVEGGQGYAGAGTSALVIGGILGAGGLDYNGQGPRIRGALGFFELSGSLSLPVGHVELSSFVRFSGNGAFIGAASGNAYQYHNNIQGLVTYGEGTTNDLTFANKAGTSVMTVPTGTADVQFGRHVLLPTGGVMKVNNQQVVGARGAAIADAVNAAGATPTQAEFNALVAVVNNWLARARAATGHGLIT